LKADKDELKALVEDMRSKLRSQSPADAKLDEIQELLKDADKTKELVDKKLGEVEQISDDIDERKKRWNTFDAESGERSGLMDEFAKNLADADEEYQKMCEGLDAYEKWTNGLGEVNTAMKDHPDYELK